MEQTRQPAQKIGKDRNRSGVAGAQFAPPPAGPKQEVVDWDGLLPFNLKETHNLHPRMEPLCFIIRFGI